MKGKLILENGVVFKGKIFGKVDEVVGEIIFNTSMVGYQELMTDSSSHDQMIVMTYPMIGNYGLNLEDMESKNGRAKAFIIREEAKLPNNFRSEMTLNGFLKQQNIVGFKGIDTRYLTQILRESGPMKGIITTKELSLKEIQEKFLEYTNKDIVSSISTTKKYILEGVVKSDSKIKTLGILDLGLTKTLKENFLKRGYNCIVFPYNTKSEELLSNNLDGLLISDGPGSPLDLVEVTNEIKNILEKIPLVGVGLGHQIIALAIGGEIKQLKCGHRGGNTPVKNIKLNKICITNQNHSYYVSEIPKEVEITYSNISDKSIEGIYSKRFKAIGVQFNPESWPGTQSSVDLFENIDKMLNGGENVR